MTNPKMQPTQNSANQTSEIGLWARPFSGIPLRTKLVVAFLIVALLPLSFLVYLNIRDLRQAAIENANQSLESAASQTAAEIDRFIGSNLSAVRIESKLSLWAQYLSLSASERRGSNIEAEVSSTLNDLSRKGQTYSPASVPSYGVIDQQGITAIDTLSQNIGQLNDEKDFFQSALQTGQPYVSPVIFSEPDKGAVLIFSSPIFNQANEFMGVLRIRYNAAILQEQVFQKSGPGDTKMSGVLLDENNIRLADGLHPDLNFKSVMPLDSALLTELKGSGRLPNISETEL
jgi:hypothetical protein